MAYKTQAQLESEFLALYENSGNHIPIGAWKQVCYDQWDGLDISLKNFSRQLKLLDIVTKGPWIDAQAFDIMPNTGADQADKVQTLFDSLVDGDEVFFRKGTYYLSHNVTCDKDITIKCTSKTLFTSDMTNPVTETPLFLFTGDDVCLKRLNVQYAGAFETGSSYSGLIPLIKTTGLNAKIKQCKATNSNSYGIYIAGGSAVVEDCDSSYNRVAGLVVYNSSKIKVRGGTYNKNGFEDDSYVQPDAGTGYGIACLAGVNYAKDIIIDGATCNGNKSKGIDSHGGEQIKVTGNTCNQNEYSGIELTISNGTTTKEIIVANNTVRDMTVRSAFGIRIGRETNGTFNKAIVAGNIVSNITGGTTSRGIFVENDGAEQIIIANNVLTDCTLSGIATNANTTVSKNMVITGNSLKNCGTIGAINIVRFNVLNVSNNVISVDNPSVGNAINFSGSSLVTGLTIANNQINNYRYAHSVYTGIGLLSQNNNGTSRKYPDFVNDRQIIYAKGLTDPIFYHYLYANCLIVNIDDFTTGLPKPSNWVVTSPGINQTAGTWSASVNYAIGDVVKTSSVGYFYYAETAISSGGSLPTHTSGTVNNWTYLGYQTATLKPYGTVA